MEPEIEGLPGHSLFAGFDGHGGQVAAIFASQTLLARLRELDSFKGYVKDQSVGGWAVARTEVRGN